MVEVITEIRYSIVGPASSSRLLRRQPMMHVIGSSLKVVYYRVYFHHTFSSLDDGGYV
jgi:hypothetical protein